MTDPRFVVGASVWAKGTVITNAAELHRRFGRNDTHAWVPGIVSKGFIQETSSGRRMRYVKAHWYLGGENGVKEKEVALSSVKIYPPDSGTIPVDLTVWHDHGGKWPRVADVEANSTVHEVEKTSAPSLSIHSADDSVTVDPTTECPQPALPPRVSLSPGANTAHNFKVHNTEWTTEAEFDMETNGSRPTIPWVIKDGFCNHHTEGGDTGGQLSRLDYFLMMFPPDALRHIITLTNAQLSKRNLDEMDVAEFLRWFGVVLLISRCEFSTRRELWAARSHSKFLPSVELGRSTGMSRQRYDDIWTCLRLSFQPETRPDNVPSEEYRWMLVDDFIRFFNDHRASHFTPSDVLVIDESIARWYGLGGDWINVGLPMYVDIDRKPESGCEIQSACCGKSGIMIRLKLVKTKSCRERETTGNVDENEGTRVLKELTLPWAKTNRLAVADSFFASVQAARSLYARGLFFTGVVKTATRDFPMQYLQSKQISERGQHHGVFHHAISPREPDLLGFTWCDRDRRYFISTTSSLADAEPIFRKRIQQVDTAPNADPTRNTLLIPQPKASKTYYDYCGRVDQHNRVRQDGFRLELKLGTHEWHRRVSTSLLSIVAVDSFLAYKGCTGSEESVNVFIHKLADELIEFERTTRFQRTTTAFGAYSATKKRKPDNIVHLTPTKKLRPTPLSPSGKENKGQSRLQKYCKGGCKKKTTWRCSDCDQEQAFCHPRSHGNECFKKHCEDFHPFDTCQISGE